MEAFPSIRGSGCPLTGIPGQPAGPVPAAAGLPVRAALPAGHGPVRQHAARLYPVDGTLVRCLLLRRTPAAGQPSRPGQRQRHERRSSRMTTAGQRLRPGPGAEPRAAAPHRRADQALQDRRARCPAGPCTPSTTSACPSARREIVALAGESGSGKSHHRPAAGQDLQAHQRRDLLRRAAAVRPAVPPRPAALPRAKCRWSSRTRSARSTRCSVRSHGLHAQRWPCTGRSCPLPAAQRRGTARRWRRSG